MVSVMGEELILLQVALSMKDHLRIVFSMAMESILGKS